MLGCSDSVLTAAASYRSRYRAQQQRLEVSWCPSLAGTAPSSGADSAPAMPTICNNASVASATSEAASSASSLDTACLFLAAKTCEEPRRIRDVINAMHLADSGQELVDSRHYWQLKEDLVLAEQRLLRALAYDTRVAQPQLLLLNCLRVFGAPRALCQLAVALLNDGIVGGGVCSATWEDEGCGGNDGDAPLFNERYLVAAVLGLGASMLEVPLPTGWQMILEVDEASVADACHAILDVYDDAESSRQCDGTCAIMAERRMPTQR